MEWEMRAKKNGRVLKSFVAKEFELGEKKGELVFKQIELIQKVKEGL